MPSSIWDSLKEDLVEETNRQLGYWAWIQDPLFEIDPSWRRESHYDDCDEDCSCWR